jgi:hypothetical protein
VSEAVRFINTNWHCEKCGREMVQPSNEPLRLQPTLDPTRKVGKCSRCRTLRMFRHVSTL